MTERARILLISIGIMAAVSLSTAAIAIYILHQAALGVHRERLSEMVQSGARLIEAIARFDARYSANDVPGGATEATLSQLAEAHEGFRGFGETGEFVLAQRVGDQIVWLLGQRHGEVGIPEPIPFDSGIAEPMVRALSRETGTMVGRDYRGVKVLAAHEWIRGLDWGLVAKMDMGEIHRPLVRAGSMVAGVALVAIAVGVGFIVRITSPLLDRIEARTGELASAHERLRSHSAQVAMEVERAQRRAAVDLHDGIGQLLALAKIKIGLLRDQAGVATPDPRLQEIASLIDQAHQHSKEVSWRLCPPVLYEVGFVAALHWLAKDMERRYGVRVTVEEEGECVQPDEEGRISLFRSVSELLINVAKHAKTDRAGVQVSSRASDIMIVVEDHGIGFDPSSNTNEYGLFSVRERLHHLGGRLTIASKRGEGTKVTLLAPLGGARGGAEPGLA